MSLTCSSTRFDIRGESAKKGGYIKKEGKLPFGLVQKKGIFWGQKVQCFEAFHFFSTPVREIGKKKVKKSRKKPTFKADLDP